MKTINKKLWLPPSEATVLARYCSKPETFLEEAKKMSLTPREYSARIRARVRVLNYERKGRHIPILSHPSYTFSELELLVKRIQIMLRALSFMGKLTRDVMQKFVIVATLVHRQRTAESPLKREEEVEFTKEQMRRLREIERMIFPLIKNHLHAMGLFKASFEDMLIVEELTNIWGVSMLKIKKSDS